MEKGPTRPEWVVWLGYASGLKPPKLWAQRDILTWRAFRQLSWERKQKDSKDRRIEREAAEHDDSINDIVVEHKAETEIKVNVIEEVRKAKRAELASKRAGLLEAWKAGGIEAWKAKRAGPAQQEEEKKQE